MWSPQPAVPSGTSICSAVGLPRTAVTILLHRASPLILASPVLFLTLFVSFSSLPLTFYTLSEICFYRGATTLAAGSAVSCWDLWCSFSSWLCQRGAAPDLFPQGPPLQPLSALPPTDSIKWHYKLHKINFSSYTFCSWSRLSRDPLRLWRGRMTASGAICDTCYKKWQADSAGNRLKQKVVLWFVQLT